MWLLQTLAKFMEGSGLEASFTMSSGGNRCWYLIFQTENDAFSALAHLNTQYYQGQQLKVRMVADVSAETQVLVVTL